MVDYHHQHGSKRTPVWIVGALLAGALIFSFAFNFIHHHHHMEKATQLHAETLGEELNVGSKWDAIYDIAKQAKDERDFLTLLRTAGLANDMDPATACKEAGSNASYRHLGEPLHTVSDLEQQEEAEQEQEEQAGDQAQAARRSAVGKAKAIKRTKTDEEAATMEAEDYNEAVKKNQTGEEGQEEEEGEEAATVGQSVGGTRASSKGGRAKSIAVARQQAGAGAGRQAGVWSDPDLQPVDGGPPTMSRKLAHAVAVNDTVIVTWANNALWDFVQSWVAHARRQGYTNFLVGAMDKEIGRNLVEHGINSFAMYDQSKNHSGVGEDHLQWGGASFHKMGRQKIALAQMFLNTQLNLLLVDVDAIILGDVLAYFRRFPEADVLVSSDMLRSTLKPGDDGLELPADAGAPMNIGIMYFKYSANTLAFVSAWLDVINRDDKVWDQNAFNDLARIGWDPVNKLHPKNKRVYMGWNDKLGVGVLPVASFPGGHTFYVQRLYEVQQVEPMMVHCTFQYGANMGKRNRMREMMIFDDPPEYWTEDTYISVWVTKAPSMPPQEFTRLNYTDMKAYNVQGLRMQLEAVYAGMGLAAMFNRSLVVPKLACYCDRYWAPLEQCQIPGATQTRLPFVCPMDYVLDPIGMADPSSPLTLRWREASFFDNPRCPRAVRDSKLTIYTSQKAREPREKWVAQDGGAVLVLPAKLGEAQLRSVLSKYRHYKWWWFHDAPGAFKGFEDPAQQEAYVQRVQRLQPIVQPANM